MAKGSGERRQVGEYAFPEVLARPRRLRARKKGRMPNKPVEAVRGQYGVGDKFPKSALVLFLNKQTAVGSLVAPAA